MVPILKVRSTDAGRGLTSISPETDASSALCEKQPATLARMKWTALFVSFLCFPDASALPLIGSTQDIETTALCQVYGCRLMLAERRRDDLANHYGIFGSQKYSVKILPLLEMTINRDYDGQIISAAAFVPVNLEEVFPYKSLLNGFYFEVLGSKMDVASACKNGFPSFSLSKKLAESLSLVRGAPQPRTQTVNITCRYTFNNLVNPSVALDFKIKDLRMK